MSNLSITGTGHVNGGPGWPCQLRTETERIDISTNLPKSDPNWTHVDSNGHFHAYNQRDGSTRYPTLYTRVEEVPCGDPDHGADCDGANVTHWLCMVCDEEVKPGKIPGPHYEFMDGPMSWEARIQVPSERAFPLVNAREKVILRAETDDNEVFGVGFIVGDFTFSNGDRWVTLTVKDAGPLGGRKPRRTA